MKKTILVVDDQEINRILLAEVFKSEFEVVEAENGEQALNVLNERTDIIAVMLDLMMPVLDGISVLKELNRTGKIYNLPVFIITSADDNEMLENAYALGAVDIISKPFRMVFVKSRIENIIELYQHRNRLTEMVQEGVEKIHRINIKMAETLAAIIEFRDCESGEHVKRIRGLTARLMTALSDTYPEYHLDKGSIDKISIASILHDVGKIAIPDHILKKPGKLTEEEFEIMKIHTVRGCDILAEMPEDVMDHEVYRYSYEICRHHHERWDGKGYPDQLAGDEIPIWSQAVGVADVFDALTSPRVYKEAYDYRTAVRMINDGECGLFNPKVLEVFNKIAGDMIAERERYENASWT